MKSLFVKYKTNFYESILFFSEASIACLIMMVKFDLSNISSQHLITALYTGVPTSIIYFFYSLTAFSRRFRNRLGIAVAIDVIVFCVDIFNHPSHFYTSWDESLYTGTFVAVLTFMLYKGNKKTSASS
ncbi:MAG: hypothetical protein CND43_04260 [Flavobacteriales bacterium MED-G15]|nr:MAG: hypothetical protein CND43_04260 [Flavobacteriales bacterium MED-G15]